VKAMRDEPLGAPIFWIVPKQATFSYERMLTTESGLGGFFRARVVSFDLLGRQILEECGGTAVPEITGYGRQMILGMLLRRNEGKLRFFSSVARQAGLAVKLDATFAELERSGRSAGDLAEIAAEVELGGSDSIDASALGAKLHDLHLIYQAYSDYLGQDRLDPHRRLQQVLGSIANCSMLKGAEVYIDGFLEFTEYERQVIAGIAKVCKELEITILVDPGSATVKDPHFLPEELSLFHKTEEAYRRVYFALTSENIVVDTPVVLREGKRFKSKELGRIEAELFVPAGHRNAEQCDAVELIEARDRRAEAEAAAGRVRDLLREGYRLREISVLMREGEPYMELLSASFREHELPHFLDRRRTAGHHPVLQFMRAALQIVLHPYAHEGMIGILKSGLAGLSTEECDALENYVLLHRVKGVTWAKKEAWNARAGRRSGEEDEIRGRVEVEEIDRSRKSVVDRLRPFVERVGSTEPMRVREIVLAIFQLFEAFGVRQEMAKWIARAEKEEQFEQRAEHEQVWAELVDLFDQMCDVMGDEVVTLPGFLEILEAGMETFDLGVAPPTVDQVLIGLVDRTRSAQSRAVILVGMNEGVFPRISREDSVLSDAERKELRGRQVETEPDSVWRQLDESLLGYVAFTRASEKLILTRALADEGGKPMGASVFWEELKEVCPEAKLVGEEAGILDTPRRLVTALMNWVRKGAEGEQAKTYAALYAWLAQRETRGDAIDLMRFRGWGALSYANDASLSEAVRGKLFGGPLVASASQMESFAACPFKHFMRYGLRLEPRVEEEPTAMDLGGVYHDTLDRLVKSVLEKKIKWTELSEEKARELIESCSGVVGKRLRDELMVSNARNRYLLGHIERTIEKVVAAQKAMAERGHFVPAFTELMFGFEKGSLPALEVETPGGSELILRGKIDRVDVLEGRAFSVVDYKMSERTLNYDELRQGLSVQLLTYLLVLDAHGEKLTGVKMTPAAAFYVKLLRGLDAVKHPSEALDPWEPGFHLKQKPRGILDGGFASGFDERLGPGVRSDVIMAQIKQDGTFAKAGDYATTGELRTLLDFVQRRLGELADEIMEGNVEIRPYKMGTTSACVNCDYRSVCRFHVRTNRYLNVRILGREGTLQEIMNEGRDGNK
jgi:ATP-dependent helicase/nuclease subunit B